LLHTALSQHGLASIARLVSQRVTGQMPAAGVSSYCSGCYRRGIGYKHAAGRRPLFGIDQRFWRARLRAIVADEEAMATTTADNKWFTLAVVAAAMNEALDAPRRAPPILH
jgi:hypothetical protein